MRELESALAEQVLGVGAGRHAYSRTGPGLKELVYYIADRDEFMEKLNAALADHPPYPIEIEFHADSEWATSSACFRTSARRVHRNEAIHRAPGAIRVTGAGLFHGYDSWPARGGSSRAGRRSRAPSLRKRLSATYVDGSNRSIGCVRGYCGGARQGDVSRWTHQLQTFVR